ncbi:uncharacterized protein LOC126744130 [Anthonomus grandis grandis]|uniref:uncharacterized protein LOC126744130 n=1 Tax=Anthonomus grandis grandis TaxID=2921223 RepID=UPI0021663199|nr:uncharacterized protein LOC126744130 [Anthonomus grandis grandis]XP_050307429.1 uncharacterized protein LOC126744130 [Anthonomus grandis grandis]XP_050307430.1 uncharacterized protein LOC126744130 [Anthonomus grandis grandis]XP_050307431.1 uncharacterized protein LOC126744130 [Anthonomus grandis grandis]
MSKDDFDIFRHLSKPEKATSALDLLSGLHDRQRGNANKKISHNENLGLFAEDQLVRKQDLKEMRCEMPGHPRSTFLMVFSPDGRRSASTHGNHSIYVTDLRSGKNIKTLVGHPRTPWCIAFHPTSDQIVASGCLGGQVRIWDLSGGSEVWTTATESVIASIAFHPNDRILVIATLNEVYFWDWSRPEPFVHVATSNQKEKVRYVAFDKLGHKLITGIANNPQTRWERVRAPVPVPRQERSASPYRRRITQRLVTSAGNVPSAQPPLTRPSPTPEVESSSAIPERERRITQCYRNLVREYELLVHRYLQLYRPPTMIDRGTDPMEPSYLNSGTQTASSNNTINEDPSQPGPSGLQNSRNVFSDPIRNDPGPSSSTQTEPSSSHQSQPLITPSRIFTVIRKPPSSIQSTQTTESRKHKSEVGESSRTNEKRFKRNDNAPASTSETSQEPNRSEEGGTGSTEDRTLVVNLERLPTGSNTETSSQEEPQNLTRYKPERKFKRRFSENLNLVGSQRDNTRYPRPPSEISNSHSERMAMLAYIRANWRYPGDARNAARSRRDNASFAGQPGPSGGRRHREAASRGNAEPNAQDTPIDLTQPRIAENDRLDDNQRADDSTVTSGSTSGLNDGHRRQLVEEVLTNIRRMAEEVVRNRILPIIRSIPPPDRPELIRLFENSREHVRMRMRLQQMCPVFLRRHCRRTFRIESSTDSSSSDNDHDGARLNLRPSESNNANTESGSSGLNDPVVPLLSSTGSRAARNYTAELDQLITTFLNEIEPNEGENSSAENLSQSGSSSARTRPSRYGGHPWSGGVSHPPGPSIDSLMSRDELRTDREEIGSSSRRPENRSPWSNLPAYYRCPYDDTRNSHHSNPSRDATPRGTFGNADTRTTNSTIYTSSSNGTGPAQRRRFFSRRVSAFMPTRVNYTRSRSRWNSHYTWGRAGLPRSQRNQSYVLDELINYSERENSEDDPPPPPPPIEPYPYGTPSEFPPITGEIGTMYTNIQEDVQLSWNDVRNMRAPSVAPSQIPYILSNFSERMENITNISNRILRNLRTSINNLPTTAAEGSARSNGLGGESRLNFNDPSFYVRDLRTEINNPEPPLPSTSSTHAARAQDVTDHLHAVTSDHTYPLNPNDRPTAEDNNDPSVANHPLYLITSHIQKQASLLRNRVQNIEEIDRATREVSQLQIIRQLVSEMVRFVRTLPNDSRSSGVSSVRQMMAGTRISDSSPYESPNESETSRGPTQDASRPQPGTSSSSTSSMDLPGPSSAGASSTRRTPTRKTYPPSRYVRLSRHFQRRPALVHLFSKRCPSRCERGGVRHLQCRLDSRPPLSRLTTSGQTSSGQMSALISQMPNFSIINSATLTLMSRRLERTLTDQVRAFTCASQNNASTSGSNDGTTTPSVDLREHMLAMRLHGCLLRMTRVLGEATGAENLRRLRSDPVTRDGASRYTARHTLSLVVDGVTRFMEELGSGGIPIALRTQLHGVFAMLLLLTELLLLQIVDSIPSASEFNLDPYNLVARVETIYTQMLQGRYSEGTAVISRSLKVMGMTMRIGYMSLNHIYEARRSAIMSRQATDRRQLLGIIDRCLRTIGRMHNLNSQEAGGSGASTSGGMSDYIDSFYSTINDLISRYSERDEETTRNQPSTSREARERRDAISSNNNSDTDQDEPDDSPERFLNRNESSNNPERSSYTPSPGFWLYATSQSSAAPPPPNQPSSSGAGGSSSNSGNNVYRSHPYITLVPPSRRLPAASAAVEPPPVNTLAPPATATRPWNIPSVQVNDVPVAFEQRMLSRQNFADTFSQLRSNPRVGLFRPRFLHPLYASVNPFDADLDDLQREQIYDSDMITTATPNHRIQAWEISNWMVPTISNSLKNVVVGECKIHNDASVDIATDGTILVTLLPSGGYLNVTNRLGVYSLRWETLGQCLYTTSFEQNAVSVSLSPLSRHLVVGFASRRVSIVPSDRWVMARIYKIEQKDVPGDRLPALRELEQHRESRINCIRWLPSSGQGLIYATNTGQLVILS